LDDIEPLARSFFAKRGYPEATLSPGALMQLKEYSWRGNIRELFNVLERAAIIAQGGPVQPEHLLLEDEIGQWQGDEAPMAAPVCVREAPPPVGPGRSVREMEEHLIFNTLKQVNDNRTRAAKLLGISVRTLRNKLRQYREKEFDKVV
jgi:two-component system response regulator FlrC